jgi:Lrp/AsnC family leucine-responsive transcriptional regulator
MKLNLDKIDLTIIELLKENSKQGNKSIAAHIGLTLTPTYERIKRMERIGVIERYTIKLNKLLIGKGLEVYCLVSLKEHNLDLLNKFEEQVAALNEVNSCYHLAGNHDYALLIQVDNMQEYEYFLKHKLAIIPSIANVESSFVMSSVK